MEDSARVARRTKEWTLMYEAVQINEVPLYRAK